MALTTIGIRDLKTHLSSYVQEARAGNIVYLDSSALVRRYVVEIGSQEVVEALAQADIAGTVVITRAEVAAAFFDLKQWQAAAQSGLLTYPTELPNQPKQ